MNHPSHFVMRLGPKAGPKAGPKLGSNFLVNSQLLLMAMISLSACSSKVPQPNAVTSAPQSAPSQDSMTFEQESFSQTDDDNDGLTQDAAPILRAQRLIPQGFGVDGFPKVRRYFKLNTNPKILERIDTDFNGDGRVDFIEHYDASGQFVERESADLNGNGLLSVTSIYKKMLGQQKRELIRQEYDSKFEGKPSVWKYYRSGTLARREIDRRGLGRPDLWEHYENGKLVRIERDENADGLPDSEPTFKQVVRPKEPEPGKASPSEAPLPATQAR